MNLIEKIDAEIARLRERSLEMDPGSESRLICRVKIDELSKIRAIAVSEQKDISQKLTDIYNEYPYKVVGRSDSYSKYNEAWTDAIYRVAEVLGVDF